MDIEQAMAAAAESEKDGLLGHYPTATRMLAAEVGV